MADSSPTPAPFELEADVLAARTAISVGGPQQYALACDLMLALSGEMWELGRWREFDADIELGIAAAVRHGDQNRLAALLAFRSGLFEALGSWDIASDLARRALALKPTPGVAAVALLHLGTATHNLGNESAARRCFRDALSLFPPKEREIAIKIKLRRVELALGSSDRGEALLDEVLDWAKAAGRPWILAEVLLDHAGFLRDEQPAAAILDAERARMLYAGLGFERGVAFAELELARINRRSKDAASARRYLGTARSRFERMKYQPGLAHTWFELGRLDYDAGSFSAAVACFCNSRRHAIEASYRRAIVRASLMALKSAWHATQPLEFLSSSVQVLAHMRLREYALVVRGRASGR